MSQGIPPFSLCDILYICLQETAHVNLMNNKDSLQYYYVYSVSVCVVPGLYHKSNVYVCNHRRKGLATEVVHVILLH